jgi:hypothetical protein
MSTPTKFADERTRSMSIPGRLMGYQRDGLKWMLAREHTSQSTKGGMLCDEVCG